MNEPNHESDKPRGLFGWIRTHPKSTVVLVLFVGMILSVLIFDYAMERRLAGRIQAIREKGMPTTLEELVATLPMIDDDENMAIPILKQADAMLAVSISGERKQVLPIIGSALPGLTGCRLPEDQLEAVQWYLSEIEAELAAVHEALKLERGCVPIGWRSPAIQIMLPHLMPIRLVGKALSLEATLDAEEGNADSAGAVLADLCHLERVMECDTFIIGALVRIAIQRRAFDQIERTVNLCGLSEQRIRDLDSRLLGMETSIDFKGAMMGERVSFLDTMSCLRSGNGVQLNMISSVGTGGSTGIVAEFWRYLPALPEIDTAFGIELYNEKVDGIGLPDAATIQAMKNATMSSFNIPRYCLWTRALMPSFSRTAVLWVRGVGQNRALRAALACERFRLDRGTWPNTLDALVPDYLERVPIDPFDGMPIRFAIMDEGIKVWTIAENNVDDGGDVGRLEKQNPKKPSKDSGWVFLNPDLRGRPAEEQEP